MSKTKEKPIHKSLVTNSPSLKIRFDTPQLCCGECHLADPVYENHTIHSNDPSDRPLRIAEAIEIIAATCKKMRGVKLKDTNQIVDNKRNDLRILGEGIDNTEYFSIKQFSEQPSLLEKITGLPSRAITLAPNEVLIIREYTEVLPKGRLGSTYTDFIPAMLNQP